MIRCYKCATFSNHLFKDCLSKDCSCNCVQQLCNMKLNMDLEKMSNKHPRFMNVKDTQLKTFPDLGYALSNMNRIRKWEWVVNEAKKRYRGRSRLH